MKIFLQSFVTICITFFSLGAYGAQPDQGCTGYFVTQSYGAEWEERSDECEDNSYAQCSSSSDCQWLTRVLTVFNSKNYDGKSVNLPISNGGHSYGNFDKLKDKVSSVIVPSGSCLSLYQHEDQGGAKLTLQPGSYQLTDYAFDDYAESWSIETSYVVNDPCGPPDAILYWGWNQNGDQFPLYLDEHQTKLGRFNDDASSIWVDNGICLILWKDAQFDTESREYGFGYHNLTGINDWASSAKIVTSGYAGACQ